MPPPMIATLVSEGKRKAMRPVSDTVISLVNGLRLFAGLVPIPTLFRETIRAKTFNVLGRLGLHERLYQHMTNARRAGDAVRITASRHDEAFKSATLAND